MPAPVVQKGSSPTLTARPEESKIRLTNMQARTLSISILLPTLSYIICYSKVCTTCIVCFCMFCAGLEWSGVKRHLKVQLLLWSNNMNASETLSKAFALSDGSSPTTTSPRFPTMPSKATLPQPRTRTPLGNSNGSEGGGHASHDTSNTLEIKYGSQQAVPHQYARPVIHLGLYNIIKHLGWTLLPIAAHHSEKAFLITLAIFFLVFVAVTLIAHNRLEMKVQEAVDMLSKQIYSKPHIEISNGAAMTPKTYEAHQFRSMELLAIAEKQPTEQFLDFSLDIFGMMWISGLAFALFTYSKPQIGVRWAFSATMSNFINDICALLLGRGIRRWHERFKQRLHLEEAPVRPGTTDAPPSREAREQSSHHNGQSGAAATAAVASSMSASSSSTTLSVRRDGDALRSVTRFEQWILRMPHPLYKAISPNKSLEGALGGALASAVSFALCMYVMHPYDTVQRGKPVLSPRFDSLPVWLVLGIFMGAMGVMGDLLQSLLKRSAHIKDTGALIPGHGGILDRVDGMLLLYPFLYCVLSLLQALS